MKTKISIKTEDFHQQIGLMFKEQISEVLQLCVVLKLGIRKEKNIWQVLKCGAGVGCKRSVVPTV
jgi:hypothetical protein